MGCPWANTPEKRTVKSRSRRKERKWCSWVKLQQAVLHTTSKWYHSTKPHYTDSYHQGGNLDWAQSQEHVHTDRMAWSWADHGNLSFSDFQGQQTQSLLSPISSSLLSFHIVCFTHGSAHSKTLLLFTCYVSCSKPLFAYTSSIQFPLLRLPWRWR